MSMTGSISCQCAPFCFCLSVCVRPSASWLGEKKVEMMMQFEPAFSTGIARFYHPLLILIISRGLSCIHPNSRARSLEYVVSRSGVALQFFISDDWRQKLFLNAGASMGILPTIGAERLATLENQSSTSS